MIPGAFMVFLPCSILFYFGIFRMISDAFFGNIRMIPTAFDYDRTQFVADISISGV